MTRSGSIAVIMPAAGSGQRFGSQSNKLFANLDGKPLWQHAVDRFESRSDVGLLVLAVSADDESIFREQISELNCNLPIRLVRGGATRSESVQAGLDEVLRFTNEPGDRSKPPTIDRVAIHDAARPLVRQSDLDRVFAEATSSGAALLVAPVSGTLKRDTGSGSQTVDRRNMYVALTPQVFAIDVIRQAYARDRGRMATDDAQLVERTGHPVQLVTGSADNLKITYPEDLRIAEAILNECRSEFV
ncbi:2-C-methyl-D-erythritol 4-phosphate cytidylyltransferase [Rhodopirellula sp. JC740]|uniref:2-C-methyl-D-erythritol 4-phosphate cytidylyltransferase n=1 Tax=Rhodopirellula halodulae TaxID=2894198 RepID=A0ABS8NK45_9BACT|nr:2-C-methyl-D-erythritol 4-phosphate cytidylyltransferase [Rhodopirellula sp. JC740]MCC9643764.1 2-C-methyl-D-erythritol 4-phosphate cytidylyltransferase [Rhodopirellula sp. JC740]